MITINGVGNCNVQYASGLVNYLNKPEEAMASLLTMPKDPFYDTFNLNGTFTSKPCYRKLQGGICLFAQGSEDPVKDRPYAPQFKAYIEAHGLGTVLETGEVPNPMHANKPAILYVWILNRPAIDKWFEAVVVGGWQSAKAKEEAAAKAYLELQQGTKAKSATSNQRLSDLIHELTVGLQ